MHILWYVLSMRCDEADRIRCRCSADATWWQRLGERLHRVACSSCRVARRQLDVISEAVDRHAERFGLGAAEHLSNDARASMIERLHAAHKKN